MTEIKDKIKKLLKKAKEAGDMDMVELAMELLDEIPVPRKPDPRQIHPADEEPVEVKSRYQNSFEEFAMNNISNGRQSVAVPPGRVNKFVDDGTEHRDDLNKTPDITRTERSRPKFSKIMQVCSKCNKQVEVHPAFKRDFFVCDKCLRR